MTGATQVRWGIIGTANIARAVFLPGLRQAGGDAAAVAGREVSQNAGGDQLLDGVVPEESREQAADRRQAGDLVGGADRHALSDQTGKELRRQP